MPEAELRNEIAAGIDFSGCYETDRLIGVMGIQNIHDVTLIRHAYVDPAAQRSGIGAALLDHLKSQTDKPNSDRHVARGGLGDRILPTTRLFIGEQ